MSETAQTLIKGAMRVIGAIASGESPTADELADGLEAMKMMFRHWSAKNIRIPYLTSENFPLTGAQSYTIGSGGNFNTVRPAAIRGGYVRDSNGFDSPLTIIDEDRYRGISLKGLVSQGAYLWYSPAYPLGKVYLWPVGGSTLYIDTLKPLSDPATIADTISFPPEYDEAIKFQLALRLAPEYGKEPSPLVIAIARSGLNDLETRNFASQFVAVRPEIIKVAGGRYNIDEG
jgi:hypothetical protein